MACEGTGSRKRASGQEISCSRCKGTGQTECNPRCDSCLGKGEITTEQQKEQVNKYSPPRLAAALPYKVHVTLVLIGAFVANYALMAFLFGGRTLLAPTGAALNDMGAMIPILFSHGEYWRILTSAFLHIGLAHLAFNTVALLQAGQILERQIGSARFLVVFVLSVLGGGLADLFLQSNPWMHVAGASGGLCGLIGFGIVYAWQVRDTPQRTYFTQWAVYTVVFSVLVGADHYAHGGGFVVGALLGFVLARLEPSASPGATDRAAILDRFAWPALATICGVLCVLALTFMLVHLAHSERNRARELTDQGRYGEALEPLERIVAGAPADLEAQLQRAQALEYVGDSERAIEAYTTCIQQSPDNPGLHMKRAVLLAATRHPERAQADLDAMKSVDGSSSPENLFLAAQYNMARGRWSEARSDLERLLEQDLRQPEQVEATLAQCEYHLGHPREALAKLDRLVKATGEDRFRGERAWLHFYLGNHREAMADAGAYLDHNGYAADTSTYFFLVRYFAARLQGKNPDATAWLKDALEKCPRGWPYPILRYLAGQVDAAALLAQATTGDRMTEARAWMGMALVATKRSTEAREHFEWVRDHGNSLYNEFEVAAVQLRTLAARKQPAAAASPSPASAPPPLATGSPSVLVAP